MARGADCYRPGERSTSRPLPSGRTTNESSREDESSSRLQKTSLSLNTAAVSNNGVLSPPGVRSSTPKPTHFSPLPTPACEPPEPAMTLAKPVEQRSSAETSDIQTLLSSFVSTLKDEIMASSREDEAKQNLDYAKAEAKKTERHHKAFPCMKETSLKCVQDAETELRTRQRKREMLNKETAKNVQSIADILNHSAHAARRERNSDLQKEVESFKAKVGDMAIEMGRLRQALSTNSSEVQRILQSQQTMSRDIEILGQSFEAASHKFDSSVGTIANSERSCARLVKDIEQCAASIGTLQAQVHALNERGFSDPNILDAIKRSDEKLDESSKTIQEFQATIKGIEETIWGNEKTNEGQESHDQKGIIKWVEGLEDNVHGISSHMNESYQLVDERLNSLANEVENQNASISSKANKLSLDTSTKDLHEKFEHLDSSVRNIEGETAKISQDMKEREGHLSSDLKNMSFKIKKLEGRPSTSTEPPNFASEKYSGVVKDLERRLDIIEARAPLQSTSPANPQISTQNPNVVTEQKTYHLQLDHLGKQIQEQRNQLSDVREVLRFLEDRYNNVTTNEVVNAMVHQVRHLYPPGFYESRLEEVSRHFQAQLAAQVNVVASRVAALEKNWTHINGAISRAENALNTSLSTSTRLREYSDSVRTLSTRVEVVENLCSKVNTALGEDLIDDLKKLRATVDSLGVAPEGRQSNSDESKRQLEDHIKRQEEAFEDVSTKVQRLEDLVNRNKFGSSDYKDQIESLDDKVAELSAKHLHDSGIASHKVKDLESSLAKSRTEQNARHEETKLQLMKLSKNDDDLAHRISEIDEQHVDLAEQTNRVNADNRSITERQRVDHDAIEEAQKLIEGIKMEMKDTKMKFEETKSAHSAHMVGASGKLGVSSEDLQRRKEKKRKSHGDSSNSDKRGRLADKSATSRSPSGSSIQPDSNGNNLPSLSVSHHNKKLSKGGKPKAQDDKKHMMGPYAVQANRENSGFGQRSPASLFTSLDSADDTGLNSSRLSPEI